MATFGDLKRFLELDGWLPVPNRSRGRARGGDHDRYEKPQPSGRPYRTKVSRRPNEQIGDDLFGRILRDQLHVDENTFREVIRGEKAPAALRTAPPVSQGVPGWVVLLLITKVGLTEDQIETMNTDGALRAWEEASGEQAEGLAVPLVDAPHPHERRPLKAPSPERRKPRPNQSTGAFHV